MPEKAARPRFGVELRNVRGEAYRVGFDAKAKQWFSDRTRSGDTRFAKEFAPSVSVAPAAAADSGVRMRLIVDVASAELFADGGLTVMSEVFFLQSRSTGCVSLQSAAEVQLAEGRVHRLAPIWRTR
ncbi:MAG: GH32 C-terminal domain-containing protein [Gemmatimonadaceae bacterium]